MNEPTVLPAGLHHQRAVSLLAAKRASEAVQEARQAVSLEPMNADHHCMVAQCELSLGHLRAATSAAQRAVACDPHGEWGFRVLALSYSRDHHHPDALRAAREAIRLAPETAAPLLVLAECQLAAGQGATMSNTVSNLLRIAPELAGAHVIAGRAALATGNNPLAEAEFLRSLELDPLSAVTWNNLGVARMRRGRRSQAVDAFTRSAQIDPGFELAQTNLKNAATTSTLRTRYPYPLILSPMIIPFVVGRAILSRRSLRRIPESARPYFLPRPLGVREAAGLGLLLALGVMLGVLPMMGVSVGNTILPLPTPLWTLLAVAVAGYGGLRAYETVRWRRLHGGETVDP